MNTTADDFSLPSWPKLLREGPAIARLVASPFRSPPVRCAPADLGPVMVMPGFMTGDFHTNLLRRTIRGCGGRAFGWGGGLNVGMDPAKFAGLLRRIDQLTMETGDKLTLIGWSLGGLYARELAKRRADKLALLVTLGTAFSHGVGRNNARQVYNMINDHDIDFPPVANDPAGKPPVFTVACWSPVEGIVAPASASGEADESDARVELHCAHHDMVTDPEAVRTIIAILHAGRALSSPSHPSASEPAALRHLASRAA